MPVQGGLAGKASAEPRPEGREEVTSGKREELGQWPWLQTFPFRQTLLHPPVTRRQGCLFTPDLEAKADPP